MDDKAVNYLIELRAEISIQQWFPSPFTFTKARQGIMMMADVAFWFPMVRILWYGKRQDDLWNIHPFMRRESQGFMSDPLWQYGPTLWISMKSGHFMIWRKDRLDYKFPSILLGSGRGKYVYPTNGDKRNTTTDAVEGLLQASSEYSHSVPACGVR